MPKKVNLSNETLSTNKVYEVILSMNKADRRRCLKFLESPFFNSSETLLSLYLIFVRVAELNGERGFSKEGVWLELFKNYNYADVNFRKYCSDLFRLIEKFLSSPLDVDKKYFQLFHFVENVKEKKIEPLYQYAISNFDEFLKSQKYFNSRHYFFKYKKSALEYDISEKQKIYKSKLNFEEISESLDVYYLIEKLKLVCNVIAHKRLINIEYEVSFNENLVKFMSSFDLSKHPGLSLFYYTYLVMENPENEKNFYDLKEIFLKNWDRLPPLEAFDVIVSAMNFCTNRTNKGEKKYYKEYFDLMQFGTVKELFIINGVIDAWRFSNFVYAALQIGEVEWAEVFIKENKHFLPEEQRESIVSFNLARVYRKRGEIEKVLDVLKNVEYTDIGYNLNSKSMLIMAYFDLDEYDTLDSTIDAFKVYLVRHKDISTQRRKSHMNFLKFTRRLMKVLSNDSKAIEKIKEDLQKEKSTTANHDWLLEKLIQLK